MQAFWEALGSKVAVMEAGHHDAVVGGNQPFTAYLGVCAGRYAGAKGRKIVKFFSMRRADSVILPASHPAIRPCGGTFALANKHEIMPLIQQLKAELDKIEQLLDNSDSEQLFNTFTYANKARRRFLDLNEN